MYFPGQCILAPERQEIWKKYGLHKLLDILENQSGETWAFTAYFVSLEFFEQELVLINDQGDVL